MAAEDQPGGPDQTQIDPTTEIIGARPLTQRDFRLAVNEFGTALVGLPARELLIGQDKAYGRLRDGIISAPPGTVIAIQAPFGAGKDALLEAVNHDLVQEELLQPGDLVRTNVKSLREGVGFNETVRRPSKVRRVEWPRALAINEVSYGWGLSKEQLMAQLQVAGKFLGTETDIVILLGDDAVADPELIGALGSPHEPVVIELERLTPDQFLGALKIRLAHALKRPLNKMDISNLIDPKVLKAMFPNTEFPVATMRGLLVDMQRVAQFVDFNGRKMRITPELFRKIPDIDYYGMTWEAHDQNGKMLDRWLIDQIRNHLTSGEQMRAMTADEIISGSGIETAEGKFDDVTRSSLLEVDHAKKLYLPRLDLFYVASLTDFPPGSELYPFIGQ